MITGAQVKAARNLLGWSQARLAKQAGVDFSAISKFEMSTRNLPAPKISAIAEALESAGVEFTNGEQPGVKLKAVPAAKGGRDRDDPEGRGDPHVGSAK